MGRKTPYLTIVAVNNELELSLVEGVLCNLVRFASNENLVRICVVTHRSRLELEIAVSSKQTKLLPGYIIPIFGLFLI